MFIFKAKNEKKIIINNNNEQTRFIFICETHIYLYM